MPFDAAIRGIVENELSGAGLIFKENSGLVGIDFDNCRNRETGEINPIVQMWLKWLPSYAEVSVSYSGIHVLCLGKIPRNIVATPLPEAPGVTVEVYDSGRHFATTGIALNGCRAVQNCDIGIEKLLMELGQKGGATTSNPQTEVGRPMLRDTALKFHRTNLETLRNARHGEGNARLNQTAFFACRAFSANVLEQTEEQIKTELLNIVTKEWRSPHDEQSARSTIDSGWKSGLNSPLTIIEDKFPEYAKLIEEFNERFYVIEDLGGKCRVCSEEQSPLVKERVSLVLSHQSFPDFKNRFIHQMVRVGEKPGPGGTLIPIIKSKGDAWLSHPQRKQYRQIVFAPNEEFPPDIRNLWRGFPFEPKKGNCSLYLDHVKKNICKNNLVKYDYLIKWMAFGVQHPDEHGHVSVVISGLKGVGKNVFAEGYSNLFGQHGIVVTQSEQITGHFNSHLRDKIVLVADEAFFVHSKSQEQILKSLITGKEIQIEAKGVNVETARNLLHIIVLGNSEWLVRATGDERRFFVLRCGNEQIEKYEYFQNIVNQLRRGGYAALLYHLLYEIDLRDFNVRNVPKTDELREQMMASAEGAKNLWQEILMRGETPGRLQKDDTVHARPTEILDWARKQHVKEWQNLSIANLQKVLGKSGMGFTNPQMRDDGIKKRTWIIPRLRECRELWNDREHLIEWDDIEMEWETIESKEKDF